MNERQTAAVNVVIGTLVVASVVSEPGPGQVLETLQSSPVLLGIGLLGTTLAVVAERADRRFERRATAALLAVVLVVPILASGHAVAGFDGVRAAGVLVMLGAVGVSGAKLFRMQSGGSGTADGAE